MEIANLLIAIALVAAAWWVVVRLLSWSLYRESLYQEQSVRRVHLGVPANRVQRAPATATPGRLNTRAPARPSR